MVIRKHSISKDVRRLPLWYLCMYLIILVDIAGAGDRVQLFTFPCHRANQVVTWLYLCIYGSPCYYRPCLQVSRTTSQYRKLVTHILQYPYVVDLIVTISMCMFISFLLIKYCNAIYNILVGCVATGATTNLMI